MFFLSPDLRVSDADRESAVDFLKEHYAAGRLSEREFDVRVDAAHRAQYESQLARLTDDLPAAPLPAPAARRSLGPGLTTAAVAVGGLAFLAMVPGEVWAPLLTLLLPLLMMLLFVLGPLLLPALAFFGLARALGGPRRHQHAQLPRHRGVSGIHVWELPQRQRRW